MHLSFKLKTNKLKSLWHRSMYQWIKRYKILFFFLFLITVTLAGYEWHTDLTTYHWAQSEKQAYLERTVKETTFNQKRFDAALQSVMTLQALHEKEFALKRDLFFGLQKKNQQ